MNDKAKKEGFLKKIFGGLSQTRESILSGVGQVFGRFATVGDEFYDELEEALILADIGAKTSGSIVEAIKKRAASERIKDTGEIREMLYDEIEAILTKNEREQKFCAPSALLVIGVNGAGKTTTVGKLAHLFKSGGSAVLVAAADTFRAAAVDQLEVWCERSGVPMIRHAGHSDPAAVVFDAVAAAKARGVDVLICDTAGRLHNKKNLMDELNKIFRIISVNYPEANLEVLLTLDATTGQNALQQAKLFNEAAKIDGIILTKLDGTAKGGVVVAIKDELDIPVRYVTVGESIEDLQPFDAKTFAKAMLGRESG
ncbi:MAG: signal recognition particle-docking protein FtsY [Defluviitaleaceae bacterium]|nr:signal recognition particle-docking protein FtsY [Defluviitaleaceae bacterium]